jgi:SAM-dependent methyltransferase
MSHGTPLETSPGPDAAASDPAEAAWDTLAGAYDQLTAFHDHDAWARQLDGLARRAGLRGRRLLDVGCGTGASSVALGRLGYDVAGVDLSANMLARARHRLGPDAELHHHDMRALPALGAFDSVWCVSDGLNFLLDERDLVAALAGFERNLVAGGLVVFDVDALAAFRTLYRSLLVVPGADQVVVFEGLATDELAPGAIAEARIDCLRLGAAPFWERTRAMHRQRHHPRPVLEAALAAAGLELAGVWGTDGAGRSEPWLDDERHNKAVYIARKPRPETAERR